MALITPGLAFLARIVLYLSLYLLSIHYAVVVLARVCEIPFAPSIFTAWGLAAAPMVGRVYVVVRNLRQRRRAAALGARLVPRLNGNWLGNLDILRSSLRNAEIGYPSDGVAERIEVEGPTFNAYIMYKDYVVTTCPEHIKLILATDFQNYVKGDKFRTVLGSVLGTGVFNSDGEMWKFHRSITRPAFTKERITDFELFDRHAMLAITKLKERLQQGVAVDFQDLMLRFTLDTATEFLFGKCLHTLSARLPYSHTARHLQAGEEGPIGAAANAFAEAFAEAQIVISRRERASWLWPLSEIRRDKTKAPMEVVKAYIDPIVEAAIARRRKANLAGSTSSPEKTTPGERQTLLDSLSEVTVDHATLRDGVLNVMIAGRDTTAITLTFAVYLLSQHPKVLKRLRAEVLETLGSHRRPHPDDLKDMKYLRAVLNETLRLFPIVPFNVRESVGEAVWPSPDPQKMPLYLSPGTKIIYSVFMMHRRKDLWGPDAEEYDPDRFIDEHLQKYLLKNSFIFLPFNAGPRICLGQQYAYNEMSFMLIRLMQNFSDITLDLSSAPPDAIPPSAWAEAKGRKSIEKVWPKMHLTMYAKGGVWMRMREAETD